MSGLVRITRRRFAPVGSPAVGIDDKVSLTHDLFGRVDPMRLPIHARAPLWILTGAVDSDSLATAIHIWLLGFLGMLRQVRLDVGLGVAKLHSPGVDEDWPWLFLIPGGQFLGGHADWSRGGLAQWFAHRQRMSRNFTSSSASRTEFLNLFLQRAQHGSRPAGSAITATTRPHSVKASSSGSVRWLLASLGRPTTLAPIPRLKWGVLPIPSGLHIPSVPPCR